MPGPVPEELRRSERFVIALTLAEKTLLLEHAERVGEKPAVLAREYLFERIQQADRDPARKRTLRRKSDPLGF